MLYSLRVTSLLAVLSLVSCTPFVTHQRRQDAPPGFTSLGPAPDTQPLTLKFALTPNNLAGLEEKLISISTPGNPDFRQWLSREEVKSYVQPSNETRDAFTTFASANGLTPPFVLSPNEDWMSLTLTVGAANQLFAASYQLFTADGLPAPFIRTLSISLPSELAGHIEVIHPSTSFPPSSSGGGASSQQVMPSRRHLERRTKRAAESVPATSNLTCDDPGIPMTPAYLQKIYGIPSTPAASQDKNNSIMVTGYVNIQPNRTDLSTFLQKFRKDISPNTTWNLIQIANATNDTTPPEFAVFKLEADLDVQYTVGVATGVPVEFLSVGKPPLDESIDGITPSILDTNIYLDGLDTPPTVVTTSYAPMERDFDESMARKICNTYMALGARGISMLFSSGDGGVRGSHDDSSSGICESNDFLVVFPASCPYITAVGGTESFSPEIATNLTGGGFSNLFPRPWYQHDATIQGFLDTLPADFPGRFNSSGRAYPDVAVQGGNLNLVFNGRVVNSGGTSFSSPIFASIVGLINDRLIEAGKPVLGFLNPWMYENQDAFTDITEGYNSGYECPTTSVAFNATKGWDPLTGVGSPVFDKLLAAAMKE
ncbi:family S53 protease-like protein [Favolaschia claudopus]|uniref:Family S53 protease-like protein n=1 Tax=Favolaschia claudopus TaxID=2862362 RepID=A0AAW0D1B4_9AGAR